MLLPLAVNSNLTHYQEVCEKAAVLHWEKAGLGERNHHGRPCEVRKADAGEFAPSPARPYLEMGGKGKGKGQRSRDHSAPKGLI
jgi:hypothetical protein